MPNYIKLGNLRIEIPEPANNGGGGGGGGSSSLLTGLLAFYNLSDLTDASGNGNTLTNNNGVTFSAGKIGNAAVFDGSNSLSSTLAVNLATAGTISTWLKSNNTSGWQTFIGNTQGLNFGVDPGQDKLFINDFDNMAQLFITGYAFDNSWVHVVATADSSTVKVYLNGTLNNSASNSLNNITGVSLGAATGNPGERFSGSLDAVGLWSRALTDAEVTELYNAGTGKEHPFA